MRYRHKGTGYGADLRSNRRMGSSAATCERNALLEYIASARSGEEIEAAEEAVNGWLEKNPQDLGVLIAAENLIRRDVRRRDGGRVRVRKLCVISSVIAFVAGSLPLAAYTREPLLGLVVGLILAVEVTVWIKDTSLLLANAPERKLV